MEIKINIGAISEPLQSEKLKTGDWGTEWAVVDKEKCTACRVCEQFCPDGCIEVKKFGDEEYAVVDYNYCKGCGVCASVCRFEAIKMELKELFKIEVC
ncbi:MAG: 4Fe-4S binding protein [Archaeoglobaceae archaeon]|nr:4Fe-4S binding protein [Archaeoglobaceae archaeon]MDW7989571.1 4Fe-4S binding protein [Archaeoglobaceae archaeon]